MRATTTIKRSELYRLVWEQPMERLATTYGLSDVGLAKICRKHDIPRPPRGYWARLQHGQKPAQAPLPQRDRDEQITLQQSDLSGSPQLPEDAQERIAAEREPEQRIEVGDNLRGCHQLISQGNQALQSARTDDRKMIILPEDAVLAVRTSKTSLRRALLILDALFKALEARGHAIAAGPTVKIQDVPVRFGISESLETRRERIEDHDLEGPYQFGHSRFSEQRVPSGDLTLQILEGGPYSGYGCQRTWRDTKTKRLETRLNAFVAGLLETAARIRKRDEEQKRQAEREREAELRRQEEAQRRTERRRLYKAEKARVNELLTQAQNYHKSRQVRELIEAVRAAHAEEWPIEPGNRWQSWHRMVVVQTSSPASRPPETSAR